MIIIRPDNVAENTAAGSGDGRQQRAPEPDGLDPHLQGDPDSDHGENGQPQGIAHLEEVLGDAGRKALHLDPNIPAGAQPVPDKECNVSRQDHSRDNQEVHWRAQHPHRLPTGDQVADESASQRRQGGQQEGAHDVVAFLACQQDAGYREGDGANDLQEQEPRLIRALSDEQRQHV